MTSRATAGSPASGAENVTWNVAGTAGAALAPNVKISLSTDGGLTYPTVLSATTPNDGSQVVTLPNINTATARIKVEAVGNYFFDVNDANFIDQPPVACPVGHQMPSAKPKKITQGHKFKVKATVTTASGVPAGTVQVYMGSKLLGTGTLKQRQGHHQDLGEEGEEAEGRQEHADREVPRLGHGRSEPGRLQDQGGQEEVALATR